MAKKASKAVTATSTEPVVKHARIELPGEQYDRLKRAADRRGLTVAAYIRQAVLLMVDADERGAAK